MYKAVFVMLELYINMFNHHFSVFTTLLILADDFQLCHIKK